MGAVMVAGALVLAGCGSSESKAVQDTQDGTVEEASDEVAETTDRVSDEPCFTVGEIGSGLSLTWDLVVASREASDQPKYVEELMDRGDEFHEDAEPDSYPICNGYQQIANFNAEVAQLNLDITLGEDGDEQYQKIAYIGNDILEVSDDEGYEWDYEFVADVSEIDQ